MCSLLKLFFLTTKPEENKKHAIGLQDGNACKSHTNAATKRHRIFQERFPANLFARIKANKTFETLLKEMKPNIEERFH